MIDICTRSYFIGATYKRMENFKSWDALPEATPEEVLAKKPRFSFVASTTWKEKISRVFNGAMFYFAAAAIFPSLNLITQGLRVAVSFYPPIAAYGMVMRVVMLASQILCKLGLIVAIRKTLAVAVNYLVYPATTKSRQHIDAERKLMFENLTRQDFTCRRIGLRKSGIQYDAFTFEHTETRGNGRWVMIAGGNSEIGEHTAGWRAEEFKRLGFNLLCVNGPNVGRSTGFATSYSIGAGQEAGLQFLEQVVKTEKALLYGMSLGGGSQAKAVELHDFKAPNTQYMVWTDRSFDTLSHAASRLFLRIAKPILFFLGIELNSVKSAKKLQALGIRHIVTQHSEIRTETGVLPLQTKATDVGNDGVIPNQVSLYAGLKRAGIRDEKRLRCFGNSDVNHNTHLPKKIRELVENELAKL